MKSLRIALRITGTIFGAVAVIHLLRIISNASVLINDWEMPIWINWMGLIATGFLTGWLWALSYRKIHLKHQP